MRRALVLLALAACGGERAAPPAPAAPDARIVVDEPPEPAHAGWLVVARSGTSQLHTLFKERVAVAPVTGDPARFVSEVLLEGELPPSFFAEVVASPDAAAAVEAVHAGDVRAAFVPDGTDVYGLSIVLELDGRPRAARPRFAAPAPVDVTRGDLLDGP